jgi:dihydroorotase
MRLVLRGGRVVDPANGIDRLADVVIDGDRIETVAEPGIAADGCEIDVAGKVVAPGFIDLHVHLREPGFEYKEDVESGTKAAAAGGFTAVCCMPNTNPAIDTPSVVTAILERARQVGSCRVYPVAALTRGMAGDQLSEIADLLAAGACAISDDAYPIQNSETMRRGMEYIAQFGALLMTHNEDKALTVGGVMSEGAHSSAMGVPGIPAASEDVATYRNIRLSELTGCRLHLLHISTAGTAGLLGWAKGRGLAVTGETGPHYWRLTDAACRGYYSNAKMNPPLRSEADRVAVKEALVSGVIDAIATDHAPHAPYEKEREFDKTPFGILGLETAFGIAYTDLVASGLLTLSELVYKMSAAPAAILGVPGGSLAPGGPADVVVLDTEARWTVEPDRFRSKSRNTPFSGAELQGRACFTVVGGRVVEA